jgi:hypothetical protein
VKEWVNDLNTTNFRIVVSIALASIGVVVCLLGVTVLGWEPTAKQLQVLEGLALVILTMMGFDVMQFWTKRSTDAGLAAAKNPSQPVNASVTVQPNGDAPSAPSRTAEVAQPVGKPHPNTDPAIVAAIESANARYHAGPLVRDD